MAICDNVGKTEAGVLTFAGRNTVELAEKYGNLFQFPEIFVREGDEIKAIPVKPSVRDKLKTNTAEIKKETQGKEHNKSEHEI